MKITSVFLKSSIALFLLALGWQLLSTPLIFAIFLSLQLKVSWLLPLMIGAFAVILPFIGYYAALSKFAVFSKSKGFYRPLGLTIASMVIVRIIWSVSWMIWSQVAATYLPNALEPF